MVNSSASIPRDLTEQQVIGDENTYLLVGRVSDGENMMMFIEAIDEEEAKSNFIEEIKVEQCWDDERDIYIDFCLNVASVKKGHVYTEGQGSSVYCGSTV